MLRTFKLNGRALGAVPLSLLCTLALLVLALSWRQITPRPPIGWYSADRSSEKPLELPLIGFGGARDVALNFELQLEAVHPARWRIRVDDCLTAFAVNGRVPSELKAPVCAYPEEIELNLAPYLRAGTNQFKVQVHNKGGPLEFEIRPAPGDPLFRRFHLLAAALIGLICLAAWDGFSRPRPTGKPSLLAVVFALGVLLQLGCFWQTPAWLRSNDYMGHVGYLRFMLENWSIPKAASGWQTYQPPLYYLLCALWLKGTAALDLSGLTITADAQPFSLLLAVAFLVFGLQTLKLMYGAPERREELLFSTLLVASAPCVFLASPRLSNDLLVQLLMVAALLSLVRFNKGGRLRDALLAFALIAFGALTKTNALLLIPAALVVVAARGFQTTDRTFKQAAFGLCLFSLIYAWYPVFRSSEPGQLHPVGNLDANTPRLLVQDTIGSYVVFNPIKVLEQPYVSNWEDSMRRRFVWEYLFRSAFYGEFRLSEEQRWVTIGILLVALQITVLIFLRLFKSLFKPADELFPFAVVVTFTLAAVLALRLNAHIGGLADFRYIYFSIVPFSAFAATAVSELRPTFRPIGRYLLGSLIFLTLVFSCYLSFGLMDPPVPL